MKTKLLIFGITGDLSKRKLLPALEAVYASGECRDLEIIGISRSDLSVGKLLGKNSLLSSRVTGFTMDLAQQQEYIRLRKFLSLKKSEQLLVYLSVPPTAAAQIVDFLGEAGLVSPNVKILFEKPFGVDLASAKEVIARTARYYSEEQIYRIDHYLAKEMAQNIVAFRGGNALFRHIWNKKAIERISIVSSETIGVERRAMFYEQTGALRDVVQGHLIQLLALTLMNIPEDFNWDLLPGQRLNALKGIASANPLLAQRAQYEGYQREVDVPGSRVETFVCLKLESNDPQWRGVPITLTTGKATAEKTTEIRVYFRQTHLSQANCLTFHVQPNEGVEIELVTKKPGYEHDFETQRLSFSYPEDVKLPDAYEQVLVDAIRSRKSLFASSAEVLESWRILDPLIRAWSWDDKPLPTYREGEATHNICSV